MSFAENFGMGLGSMILAVMQIALQFCSFSQLGHFVELDVDDIGHYDLWVLLGFGDEILEVLRNILSC